MVQLGTSSQSADTSGYVPNRITEFRERIHLTQAELALLVKLDHTTVCKHESGRGLTPKTIERYAAVFKVPTWELYNRPGDLGIVPDSDEEGQRLIDLDLD